MSELEALKKYVELAYVDMTKDPFIMKLVNSHYMKLQDVGSGIFMMEILDHIRAAPMKVAKQLREMGWYSAAVTDKYIVVADDQRKANKYAMKYRETMKGQVVTASIIEKARSTKLLATEINKMADEIRHMGYGFNTTGGQAGSMTFVDRKKNILPGDILQHRNEMEQLLNQVYPKAFSHFIITARGYGEVEYVLGFGNSFSEALKYSQV